MPAAMKLRLTLTLLAALAACQAAAGEDSVPYPILCDAGAEGCIKEPVDCRSLYRGGRDACTYIATWRKVEDGIEIEVGGYVSENSGYVALGFFPGRQLAGGIAVGCYKTPDRTGVEKIVGYYRTQEDVEFLSSDLLDKADSAPSFDKDKPFMGGRFQPMKKLSLGVIECRVKLLVRNSREPKLKFLQDVDDPMVRVMGSLSTGAPLRPDNSGLERPTWYYATPKRPLSATGIRVPKESSGGAKAHGCLMVLAWVFCASVGTLLARYYKLQWPSRLVRNELAWFQLHRALMLACCILTCLSFIVIFIDLRGYSGLDTFPDLLHPILGIIVTILTITNPLVSLCRCKPTDDDRPWFNWIHWLIGTVAYVLAVLNLFLGLRLERAGSLRSIDYHVWLLILFVLFQFVVEIILEIHTLYHWRRNKKRWQVYRQEMQEYQTLRADAAVQQPKARPVEPRPAGYCLRTFLLVLHSVVAAAVAFILIIVIIAY